MPQTPQLYCTEIHTEIPEEILHGLTYSGMPLHELTLKIGAPVVCLRNLSLTAGVCNGTRGIVVGMEEHMVAIRILKLPHGHSLLPTFSYVYC